MKIKYEFADGTVSEVEVEESIGAVIIESRRKEDNLARKERYHCYSMDSVQFEGDEYGTEETPETQMERELDTERIAHALDGLSEVQRRRLLKFAEGKSILSYNVFFALVHKNFCALCIKVPQKFILH